MYKTPSVTAGSTSTRGLFVLVHRPTLASLSRAEVQMPQRATGQSLRLAFYFTQTGSAHFTGSKIHLEVILAC